MSKISFEKDFSRHPLHYFTLLCIELVGLWGVFWFSYQPATQMVIISCMSVSYVIWGIVHHKKHRDLHLRIVLEYILMAVLAMLIVSSILLRA